VRSVAFQNRGTPKMELEYQTETGRPERRVQPRKLGPLLRDPETPFAAPTPLFLASNRETDEIYGAIVAVINPELRIVTGSCGLQWIVQRRRNPLTWTSFAFCKTKSLTQNFTLPALALALLGV
jgi:hypothetical protein